MVIELSGQNATSATHEFYKDLLNNKNFTYTIDNDTNLLEITPENVSFTDPDYALYIELNTGRVDSFISNYNNTDLIRNIVYLPCDTTTSNLKTATSEETNNTTMIGGGDRNRYSGNIISKFGIQQCYTNNTKYVSNNSR